MRMMTASSQTIERRRTVRLRPLPDLPATARLADPQLDLQVWDVSVGGLAVVAPTNRGMFEPGTRHRLHLDLGRYGAFDLQVLVRHCTGDAEGTVGMQIIDAPQQVTTVIGRYVAELLTRGAPS